MVTTEDWRAALDAEGVAAMAAAGIPRASITAAPPVLTRSGSAVLSTTVRGHAVRLYAAGPEGRAFWFAAAVKPGAAEDICHRAETPAIALKWVLRRIPKESK
jgi:hypothetical protein